jgi:hypothetical protein
MIKPITIEPAAVYDDGALVAALGIPSATLNRARRGRQIRYTRKGKRVFYLGQWVLDWLQEDGNATSLGV